MDILNTSFILNISSAVYKFILLWAMSALIPWKHIQDGIVDCSLIVDVICGEPGFRLESSVGIGFKGDSISGEGSIAIVVVVVDVNMFPKVFFRGFKH